MKPDKELAKLTEEEKLKVVDMYYEEGLKAVQKEWNLSRKAVEHLKGKK